MENESSIPLILRNGKGCRLINKAAYAILDKRNKLLMKRQLEHKEAVRQNHIDEGVAGIL